MSTLVVLVLLASIGVFVAGLVAGRQLAREPSKISEGEHDPY